MAAHSSIIAWEIPWIEESGGPKTAGDTVTERTAAVGGAGKTGGEAEFQERILSCFFTRRWAASGDGGQVGVPMAWGHGRSQYDTFRCHWVKSEFQAL